MSAVGSWTWGRGARGLVTAGLLVSACNHGDAHWEATASDQAFLDQVFAFVQPCCASRHLTEPEQEWKTIKVGNGFSRDEALRSSCLDELRQLANASACLPEVVAGSDDPCVRVFSEPSGPRPLGGSCAFRGDCAGAPHTDTACVDKGNFVCVSFVTGVVGSHPCVAPLTPDFDLPLQTFVCANSAGLFCELSTHACAAVRAAGEPCASSDMCASARCLAGGTCAPVVAVGESCGEAVCGADARCDSATMTCVARLPIGASCGTDDACLGTCDVTSDFKCHPTDPLDTAWCF